MKRVYFIRPIGFDGPIKIGCSVSPTKRVENLALWSPFPLEILAEIQGDFALERRFHAKFFEQHQGHEWFAVTAELLSVIDAIRAGSFDIRSLPAGRNVSAIPRGDPRRMWTPEQKAAVRKAHAAKRAERAVSSVSRVPQGPSAEQAAA